MDVKKAVIMLRNKLLEKSGMDTELAIANDILCELEKNDLEDGILLPLKEFIEMNEDEETDSMLFESRKFCLEMAVKNTSNSGSYCSPKYVAAEADQFMNYLYTGNINGLEEVGQEEIKE